MTINFIEVCAGAGGMSTGLMNAGLTPILLIDNDKDCINTLKENHKNVKIEKCNFEEYDFTNYINRVDLLTGGVPCQAFSQAGKRKGLEDPRGDLMNKFIKLIDTITPKIFMIENVKGLITHNKGETIKKIISDMNKNNKYIVKYKCLNANDYEVAQKRERVFIIGILKNLNKEFLYPEKTGNKPKLNEVLQNVPKSEGSTYSEVKKQLFNNIPQGGCWINLPENLQKEYLGKSYTSGGGKRGILRRLSMNEPSLTLLCSPSQKQTERCHPLYNRPLSIREYARIQSFDDSYIFKGSISSQYKQIGNAVPVKLAKYLGLSVIKSLS